MTKNEYALRLKQWSYPPNAFTPKMDARAVYHEMVKGRLGSMYRLVQAIRDKRSTETGKEEWEISVAVAERLMQIGIRGEECVQLMNLICQRRWEEVPTLLWHSRLSAQLEFEKLGSTGKIEPNDYFDLSRLAVGLTDADVVLCDHRMLNLIERTGFNAPPHFSWKTSDQAITYFERLLCS
jgi:hypothetical protein